MGLKESLVGIFNRIKNAVLLDKSELDGIIKELQKALVSSDVDVGLVLELGKKIRSEALRQDLTALEKKELLTRLVYEELINIVGKEAYELKLKKGDKVLLIGLYGSGKTTTAVKLANYYSKKGYRCCVVGLDVHRPAAPEQLAQYAKKANIPAFVSNESDAIKIWKGIKDKVEKFDLAFIDSAGRDALDAKLIEEIKQIYQEIKPSHVLLVMSADIGQAAKKQAEFFAKALKIDGIILTKMDGTAKAGGALASCKQANAKVYFIGVGEKVNDLESFDPKQYISRLLGLGDLKALVEKIQLSIQEAERKKLEESLKKKKFNLVDFYTQISAMQQVGPLRKIVELIPGMSKLQLPEGLLDIQEQKLKRWKYAIDSMTKAERENPEIINSSRLSRISKGSHVPVSEIKELLKQYKLMNEFFSEKLKAGFDERQLQKLYKRFRFLR